jgi:DNA oxidative demethylase
VPRAPTAAEPPAGLVYRPDLLTAEEERRALDAVEKIEFRELVMRGQTARRTVRHFGLLYDYDTFRLTEGDPLPADLEWLRERAATLIDARPDELAQILVTRYPPGSTIGWHRDAPAFDRIVGISLGAACRMRFQRGKGPDRVVWETVLEPRSGYVLAGAVRWAWQHSIPATPDLRYSVTFRSLKQGATLD